MLHNFPPTLRRVLSQFAPRRSQTPPAIDGVSSTLLMQLGLDATLALRLLAPGVPPPSFRYRHFSVPKRDGSQRELVEPGPRLKSVQRAINALLHEIPVHPAAMGFRRGVSIVDHARVHAGAALIITADIQEFFPSTDRWRIEALWQQQGYSEPEVELLTRLTTYRGALPQGAPSSPALSNVVNYELDAALARLTRHTGGTFTRYADDLTFSWPDGYAPPAQFERTVRTRLHEFGYILHARKGWNVWRRADEPEMTGLVLKKQGLVAMPDSLHKIMQALARSSCATDQKRLEGYRSYQTMIEGTNNH